MKKLFSWKSSFRKKKQDSDRTPQDSSSVASQSRPGSSWDTDASSAATTKPATAAGAVATRTFSNGTSGKHETDSYTTSTVSSSTSGSEDEEGDFEVDQRNPTPLPTQFMEEFRARARVNTPQSPESQPNNDVVTYDLTDASDDVSIEIKSVEEVSEVSTLSIRSAASLEDVSDIVESDLESRSQSASFLSPMRILALKQQADSLYDNACDLHRQGKLNEALKLLKMSSDHAKDASEKTLEARSLARMGLIYNRANRQQKAIMCFRYAVKLIGDRTDNTKITALQGLARAHRILGQVDIASAFEYQAMEVLGACWQAIRERHESFSLSILIDAEDSKSPPKTFGENQERIEKYIRRELDDAESLISSGGGEETIPILKAALDYAMLLGNLELEGKVCSLLGAAYGNFSADSARALDFLKVSVQILGSCNQLSAEALAYVRMGNLFRKQGYLKPSISSYGRSLQIQRTLLQTSSGKIKQATETGDLELLAKTLNNLGEAYHALGRLDEAKLRMTEALQIKIKLYGKVHTEVAATQENIGLILRDMQSYKDALKYVKNSLEMREKLLGKNHRDVARSHVNLGAILLQLKDRNGAMAHWTEAVKVFGSIGDANLEDGDRELLARALNNMATIKESLGDCNGALTLYRKALDIKLRTAPHSQSTADSLYNMAILYEKTGQLDEARRVCERSLEISTECLGRDHPNTRDARELLKDLMEQRAMAGKTSKR
mmetsp:Transcript_15186/g.51212  ORF Transcript_15186/g.51212 Transcript_15186/m.51212 type:complete len:725 (-) Transcript_15186:178-2352(-)